MVKNASPWGAHCHPTAQGNVPAAEFTVPGNLLLKGPSRRPPNSEQTWNRALESHLALLPISLGLRWFRRHFVDRNTEAHNYFSLSFSAQACPELFDVAGAFQGRGPGVAGTWQLPFTPAHGMSRQCFWAWVNSWGTELSCHRAWTRPWMNCGLKEMEC